MSAQIACLGGACTDLVLRPATPLQRDGEVAARAARWYGGVALNVAENLARLDVSAALVTLIGDDDAGRGLLAHARRAGIDVRGAIAVAAAKTAAYVAILDEGIPVYALSDMRIFDGFTSAVLDRVWPVVAGAHVVFADTNVPAAVLIELARRGSGTGFRLVVGASSVPTIANLPERLDGIDMVFMNEAEAALAFGVPYLAAADAAPALVARGAAVAVVTQGRAGCVVADGQSMTIPPVAATVVDTTGAGDALIAGTLAELVRGVPVHDAVRAGTVLAALTVEHLGTVAPNLSRALLDARRRVVAPAS
jgi:pseudouridine kinase